jgi:hypothetical protein
MLLAWHADGLRTDRFPGSKPGLSPGPFARLSLSTVPTTDGWPVRHPLVSGDIVGQWRYRNHPYVAVTKYGHGVGLPPASVRPFAI